jgi:hypothetical protein
MNKQIITVAVITALSASVSYGAPDVLEIREQVTDQLKAIGNALLPVQEDIIQLAQAPAPPDAPGIDPAAIADWANNVATITTQRTLDGLFPRSAPRKPLIVGASGDAKARAAMEEDLTVMMRILEKAAGGKDESRPTAGGIELFSFGKSSSPRVFYIDGYGAMFTLNVRYPLLAPPPKDDQTRTNEQTNTEWEKAREEVYGRRTRSDDWKLNAAPAEEFDSQRVENLKEQIIGDLVNAKNIRGLKPDDSVTVVVLGGGTRGAVVRRETRGPSARAGGGRGGGGESHATVEVSSSSSDSGMQTTMTLRAKRSDIDAFASGKLETNDFKKKVSVQVY